MRSAIRDPVELCRTLGLPVEAASQAAARDFSVFVPPSYLRRIRPGDPNDPLLRQVFPDSEETSDAPGYAADPVGDAAATLTPGMIQKYAGRALLVVATDCAVHCRYCFRRHYDYDASPRGIDAWTPALDAIARDESIREVIFSGGDPLTLSDRRLTELAESVAEIPHVKRLRVHTRLPIVIPSRVNESLLHWLTAIRLTSVVVVHANHAQELDGEVASALERLRNAGVMLLNQSVLLRGVNDSTDSLVALSERLVEIGATPYYLHQLDRVAGAAHFEVSERRGRELIDELRCRLPGYMVPRYVREVAGEPYKTPL